MKVSSERLENCEVILTIEVDEARVETAVRQAARKVSRETNIPGFRKGKAPYHIILQMFGRQTLLQEALDELGQEVFEDALEEAAVEPFAQADLVDVQLEPMVLKMSVPVAPVVELGDYREVRLDDAPAEVTDEEIDAAIESLREENSSWVPAEREAALGDRVTYTMKIDDEEEASDPRDLVLSEEVRYPAPGFAEKIVGAKAGESLDFDITFPDDWPQEDLVGVARTYHVEVEEIKAKDLPPLDELPELVGDYEDLDGLREGVREQLAEQKEQENNQQLLEKAFDVLTEQATLEFPKVMVDEEIETILRRQDSALRQQGLDLENYLRLMKLERDAYAEQQRDDAIEQVKRSLVIGKIVELEKLQVEADELQAQLEMRAAMLGGEAANEMREVLSSPAGMQYMASDMLSGKAYERLLAIVKGEAPELVEDEEVVEDVVEEDDAAVEEAPPEVEVEAAADTAESDEPPAEEDPASEASDDE